MSVLVGVSIWVEFKPTPGRASSAISASPVATPVRTRRSSPRSSFRRSIARRIPSADPDRTLGVILVGHRRAEERHDGVAE
jgi:hypothetical protein